MKRFSFAIFAGACALLPPAAAADGALTNALAQQAIDQWLPRDGLKQVIGVMDLPQQSMAQADIRLINFTWNSPKNDPITAYALGKGGGPHKFTATATFKHYTDGRWILVRVDAPFGAFPDLNFGGEVAAMRTRLPRFSRARYID